MGTLRKIRNKLSTRDFPDPWAKKKLLRGIRQLLELPDEDVQNVDAIRHIIRSVGLRYDPRNLYGEDSKYMNLTGNGLWQIPDQLAGAMVILSNHKIETFLEIGTHTGYTFSVLSAYLYRLNPNLKALTIDPYNLFHHYSTIRTMVPMEFRNTTSEELKGKEYDCVLIDGDHEYRAVAQDFENVGRHAQVCMFHDINDAFVGPNNVPKFWNELVTSDTFSETHELLDCPKGKNVMGIGIGIKAEKNEPAQ